MNTGRSSWVSWDPNLSMTGQSSWPKVSLEPRVKPSYCHGNSCLKGWESRDRVKRPLVQEWRPSTWQSWTSVWRRRRRPSGGSQRNWCSSWPSGTSWTLKRRWRTASSPRSSTCKTDRRSTGSCWRRGRSSKGEQEQGHRVLQRRRWDQ